MRRSAVLINLVCMAAAATMFVTLNAAPRESPAGAAAAARPNLLLVTFDTTRADRLPPYGYTGARTPALDRLAREGVMFVRCYAPTVQTLPSHAALMTGLFPITNNVVSNGQRLASEALTLAEFLRGEGYRTGAIVATAPLMKVFGLAQGFQTYNDDLKDSMFPWAVKSVLRLFTNNRVNPRTTRPADRVAALGNAWLQKAARAGRPFFLWLHFIEPHSPYERHPDFARPEWVTGDGRVNAHGVREANYVNEIEFADHYLGVVLRQLDALGLTKNTLTVFTADHGESLGEQGYTGHRGEVYERIIRVPLIVRMPGRLPGGRKLATPADLVDVMPTVLELLGLETKGAPFQGQDLFSLSPTEPRSIFSIAAKILTRSPIRIAMIHGTRKFIVWPETGKQELYDVGADPAERRNLLAVANTKGTADDFSQWAAAEVRAWWQANDRLRADDFTLNPEHRERLRSLGYIGR